MVEMIKVVDKERNVLGVKSREAIHLDGDWHETFQCWFIERVKNSYYIYLQLRSASKKDFPLMYDITAAGHLLVEESEEDGVREIQEELGILVSIEQLTFLDAIPNSIKLPGFIDNEISLVYVYEVKAPLQFNFVDEEVEGIIRIKLDDFEQLCNLEVNEVTVHCYEKGQFMNECNTITLDQIVPHEYNYYKRVILKIKDYIVLSGNGYE